MKVQVNTQGHVKLELGDKLEISGTGFNFKGTEDPEFEVFHHINFALSEYVGEIPTSDDTLGNLITGKDLLVAEPRLKNVDETLSGVVVSKEPSVYYDINSYGVEVLIGN